MAGINFKGKSFIQNHHLLVKHHQLVPRKDKSLTDKVSLRDNLIVHGDNLKALKALLPMYAGKIKCIYIDPPYNTGNENWVYNDNVNSPMMQEWLGKVVDKEDLTRHDKWLCMMMPRLRLLRELLADDGLILVSIDDNEAHRLRTLMDEVFGEERFLGQIAWKTRNTDNRVKTNISTDHEYVIAYGRSDLALFMGRIIDRSDFQNPDDDPRGAYVTDPLTGKATAEERPNLHYVIENPETCDTWNPDPSRGWITDEAGLKRLLDDKRLWWPPNPATGKPRKKRFLSETRERMPASSFWSDLKGQSGADELDNIMGERVFAFPKAVDFIRRVLDYATDKDSLILDSFAGSGTTAHAVLSLNKEDAGSRRFILVECEDYAERITAERVRRVIKGVADAKDETLREGLGGSFSYFDLGPPIEMENILTGGNFPSYDELARYVFYTVTGEEFDPDAVDEKKNFIGESKEHLVYLFYKPDIEYLKNTALTLDRAKALGPYRSKRRLVLAPTKYLDPECLDEMRIDFAQLPFEIYQLVT
ncbi:MAG TPA: site-specific DNA-methyltransferase [Sedimentisphaerales bacterium]|nr:site-specific DNA-methyltransferase [Sedimentisphaerales bacterium]